MSDEKQISLEDIKSTRFVWDRMANVMTVILAAGMIGLSIFLLLKYKADGMETVAAAGILIFVTVFISIFTPLGLIVDDEYIAVKKLVGRVLIKKSDIISITPIDGAVVRRSARFIGSNGVYGYWGKFRNRTIGSFTIYATNLDKLALIETARKKYIINY